MSSPGGPRRYQIDFLTALFRDPLDPAYAQAAADRRDRPPLPAWRRAMRKTITVVVLAAIGFIFAVAYRQVVMDAPEREKVRSGLVENIDQGKQRIDALARRAEALQEEVSVLRDAGLSDTQQAALREREAATGLRRVAGDGVVVVASDGPDAAVNENARLLDYDLQQIVNALWSSGAEAVSINGRRLTALSAIRRGGGGIYVGDYPVLSPYEISAIGPSDMYDRFADSTTAQVYHIYQNDPDYGFGFKVMEKDGLVLPAAVLPVLWHAQPPGSGSGTPSPSGGGK